MLIATFVKLKTDHAIEGKHHTTSLSRNQADSVETYHDFDDSSEPGRLQNWEMTNKAIRMPIKRRRHSKRDVKHVERNWSSSKSFIYKDHSHSESDSKEANWSKHQRHAGHLSKKGSWDTEYVVDGHGRRRLYYDTEWPVFLQWMFASCKC